MASYTDNPTFAGVFPDQYFNQELEFGNEELTNRLLQTSESLSGRQDYSPEQLDKIISQFSKDLDPNKRIAQLRGSRNLNRRRLVAGIKSGAGRRLGSRSGASTILGANAVGRSLGDDLATEAGIRSSAAERIGGARLDLTKDNAASKRFYSQLALQSLQGASSARAQDFATASGNRNFAQGLSQRQLEFFQRLIRGNFNAPEEDGGSFFGDLFETGGDILDLFTKDEGGGGASNENPEYNWE